MTITHSLHLGNRTQAPDSLASFSNPFAPSALIGSLEKEDRYTSMIALASGNHRSFGRASVCFDTSSSLTDQLEAYVQDFQGLMLPPYKPVLVSANPRVHFGVQLKCMVGEISRTVAPKNAFDAFSKSNRYHEAGRNDTRGSL